LVIAGFVLDSCGFIRRTKFYAGNQSESEVMGEIIEGLNGSPENLVIMDSRIATEENIEWLVDNNYKYLVVGRRRNNSFDFSLATPIKTVTEEAVTAYRRVYEEDSEVRLYCYSEKRKRERAIIKKKMDKFENILQNLNDTLSDNQSEKELTYISEKIGIIEQDFKGISQFYKITVLDNLQSKKPGDPLQASKILLEKIFKPSSRAINPRVYCLKTNDMSLSPDKMWQTKKRFMEVRSGLKSIKTELGLPPNYNCKEDRIEAHLFVTLLAYQSVQNIRSKLKVKNIHYSWLKIIRKLSCHQMVTIVYKRKDGKTLKIRKASKPDLWQEDIYLALGIQLMPGGTSKIIE
jgi:hypothetical protein